MIKGYKAFRENMITQSDLHMEVGKTYTIDKQIKWNGHGYHFCTSPEDTLGFMKKYNGNTIVCEVHTDGETISHDDDYYGLYDCYVSNKITIDKQLSRDELFKLIISRGEIAIKKMIMYYPLTQEEIDIVLSISKYFKPDIDYYQYHDIDAYKKTL